MIDWVLSRKDLVFHDGAWIAQSTLAEYHEAGLCNDLRAHAEHEWRRKGRMNPRRFGGP
jgi:hypothetical protein